MNEKRMLVSLVIAAAFLTTAAAQDRLTAVVDPSDGKYLYLDDRGTIALAGPFDRAESYSGRLGRVSSPEGTQYLRPNGTPAFTRPEGFDATARFSEDRGAFVRGGLLGFFDASGNEVIAPQFGTTSELPVFAGGRAVVSAPEAHGWVKANGTFVSSPGPILPFVQGLTFVQTPDGWRLIDAEARWVGSQAYSMAGAFSEGWAPVTLDEKPLWIDATGKTVLTVEADKAGPFVGGFAVVIRGGRAGLVDRRGKESLVPSQFRSLVPLHGSGDALKVWKAQEREGGTWVLVNEKGTAFSASAGDEWGTLAEGMVAFRSGALWGYADPRGRVVLEPQWKAVGAFASGLAAVSSSGWGLIDKKGKAVGPQTYQALGELQNRRRTFLLDGKAGVLDEKGAVASPLKSTAPPGFVSLGDAVAPLRVMRPVRWGVIDASGAWVVGADHAFAWLGEDNRVAVSGEWSGLIDAAGQRLATAPEGWQPAGPPFRGRIPVTRVVEGKTEVALMTDEGSLLTPRWANFRGSLASGVLCVQLESGRWGFVDREGRPLFDQEWDDAQPFSEDRAAVAVEGQWGYLDGQGVKIIPYQYGAAAGFHNGLAAVNVGETPSFITKNGQRVWP